MLRICPHDPLTAVRSPLYVVHLNRGEHVTKLYQLIKDRGLTQRWIARQLGVSEDKFNRWAEGKAPIDPAYIRPLAKVLMVRQKDLRDD